MKTLIHSFYLTMFIAVWVLGLYGELFHSVWQDDPAKALQACAFLFAFVWLMSIAASMFFCGFGEFFDDILHKFSRKPRFGATASPRSEGGC